MSTHSPDFRTILKYAAGGIGAALALYFALDRLVEVNHVGLLQRLGFPWSSLTAWIAVGAMIGLVRGVRIDLRMRRHAQGFATSPDAMPPSELTPGLELVDADEQGLWERDPTLREMPLLRETTGPASRTQSHEFSHRRTGDHRGRPLEVFDLTTEVRATSGDSPSGRTLRRTVVLLPGIGLPAFELKSRTLRRRFLRGMGLNGLDFDPRRVDTLDDAETVATFIKAHDVGLREDILASAPGRDEGETPSPDGGATAEEEVRRLFTPAAMRVLNRWLGWSAESHGGHLALWRDDGWFIPADERPARVVQALAIAEALEAARRGDDRSGPVPAGSGLAPRQRLVRTQVTARVGGAGMAGGFFLGFAAFASLMFASQPGLGGKRGPGPPPFFWYFPLFPLGGALLGGLIGAVVGRLAVFPIVRNSPPLAWPGAPDAGRRGRSWRSSVGMFAGFFLGILLGVLTIFLTSVRNRGLHGPMGALTPLVFIGGAAIGLFTGATIGLILDFRHAARAEAGAPSERVVSVEHR